MKKFKFNIRGNNYNVELLNIEDNIAEIEVNGSTYQVEIEMAIKEAKTPKLIRPKIIPSGGSDVIKTSKPSDRKGVGFVKAPLPGTILELKVKLGDDVKVGDTLLIMEAMKMENDITAPKSGTIKEIKVKKDQSVSKDDILIIID